MNRKIIVGVVGSLLCVQANAYAMSCEVDFRAKRMVEDSRWFGTVKRPEFKSGTVNGEGETRKACEQDALASIKQEGWQITYQRFRETVKTSLRPHPRRG